MKHIAAAIATAWAVCLMLAESSSAGQTSRDLLQTAIVGASGSYDVAPFTSLVVCVPFTVLVAPSAPDKYSMTTAYDDQVAASVVYKVQAQTLYVDISKDYESSEAIKMTINLPSNKLKAVTSTGVGDLVVNPGFNTTGTTISSQGTGSVSVRGMATQNLTIHNSGTGSIFAAGDLSLVNLKASGTGTIVLSGAARVTGQLDGTTNLYVDTPDGSSITVDATGINTIYYTNGACALGQKRGIAQCKQSSAADFPTYTANWTCGIRVEGAKQCAVNAAAAAAGAGVRVAGHRRLFAGAINLGTVITEVTCATPAGALLIPAD